jgi:pimeloyl-ACP methyl ester carboxylesterase
MAVDRSWSAGCISRLSQLHAVSVRPVACEVGVPGSLVGVLIVDTVPIQRRTQMSVLEVPTTVAVLQAGPVECRLERRGEATIMVFHGGHMRAGLALGEEVFAEAGYTVLVPSRPGYGQTPVSTGGTVEGFTDATRELCTHLGITRLAAVVGVSGVADRRQ